MLLVFDQNSNIKGYAFVLKLINNIRHHAAPTKIEVNIIGIVTPLSFLVQKQSEH
jgi:hypothetical protein